MWAISLSGLMLADYKRPRVYWVVTELLRTATGKIMHNEVLEEVR